MKASRLILLAAGVCLVGRASAFAQQNPRLDEVLKSINASSRGEEHQINITACMLLVIGFSLAFIAIKHWNSRQAKPKVLSSHSKLMKEVAAIAGVSPKKLKALESLSRAQGMSSPLVAMLCPSAITTLAKNVKTEAERQAVQEMAKQVLKP